MIKFILPAIIVLLIVVFWEKITKIVFKKSKDEKILPLGLTDGAIIKKDINKDQSIRLDDVELSLPEDVVKARQYQYDLV